MEVLTTGFQPSNEYEAKAHYYLEGLGGKEILKTLLIVQHVYA